MDTFNEPPLYFHKHKEMRSLLKQVHVFIENFVDLKVLCAANNFLQQVIQSFKKCVMTLTL